ncbi:MAG: metallophosphoesterase [Halobacteriota archaeon]|nr:metallophosphoesterase [Halobacteriota archaeon]
MMGSNLSREGERRPFKNLVKREGIRRVVAISDIHGYYDPFVELLERSGIIERVEVSEHSSDDVFKGGDGKTFFRYLGEDTILVLVGDTIDGDLNTKKIIDLIIKLEGQARIFGGEVHVLMGNHEHALLQTSWKGIEYSDSSPHLELDQAFDTVRWIRKRPVVAIINDVLFVHGGISKRVLKRVKKAQMNNEIFISAFDRLLSQKLSHEVTTTGGNCSYDEETLQGILRETNSNYLVIGHISTYGKRSSEIKQIGVDLGGQKRVFAIDTEISDHNKTGHGTGGGGALSLVWTDEGIEAECIYLNGSSQKTILERPLA